MFRWYAVGARSMCPRSVSRSSRLVVALRPVRSGKWKHLEGTSREAARTGSRRARGCRASAGSRISPVDYLPDRLVERCRVVDRRERREANGHALGERVRRRVAGRTRGGTRRPCRTAPAPRRAIGARPARPPELVGVGVDHPVRADSVAASRAMRATHSSWRRSSRLVDQVDLAVARVPQHLGRAVLRAVVGRDHEVRHRRSGGR